MQKGKVMIDKNENERTTITVVIDHTAKTVGIKWQDKDGYTRGFVLDTETKAIIGESGSGT